MMVHRRTQLSDLCVCVFLFVNFEHVYAHAHAHAHAHAVPHARAGLFVCLFVYSCIVGCGDMIR